MFSFKSATMIPVSVPPVKKSFREYPVFPGYSRKEALLFAEGHAVRALVHGGVALMGADQDAVQRTVVLPGAVVGAVGNGAFDTLVGVTAHSKVPPKKFLERLWTFLG